MRIENFIVDYPASEARKVERERLRINHVNEEKL